MSRMLHYTIEMPQDERTYASIILFTYSGRQQANGPYVKKKRGEDNNVSACIMDHLEACEYF